MNPMEKDKYCTQCGSLLYYYALRSRDFPFDKKNGRPNYDLMSKCPMNKTIFGISNGHDHWIEQQDLPIYKILKMNNDKPLIVKEK